MLVQTPSKILKSDYRFWDLAPSAAIADVYKNERKVGGTDHTLYEVLEFVIYRDSQNLVTLKADQKAIFLPLYGKIRINNFQKVIEAGEAVIFEASEDQDVFIKNILTDEDADVLVIKFNKKITENS